MGTFSSDTLPNGAHNAASSTGLELLSQVESLSGLSKDSPAFAAYLDKHDGLASTRGQFNVPGAEDGSIYFAAHALGACPKAVGQMLQGEVQAWSRVGTKGHVEHPFGKPWVETDSRHRNVMADIVGALPSEVVYASGLTNNLHVLLQSFYRPTAERYKIIYEFDAFNSDRFALRSQAQLAGYDPATALIGVKARPGERIIRHEDILSAIEEHGESACLVMFGAVNWGTGQLLDVKAITAAAREKGCMVGWDIAHGVGNVPFELHDWNVDFAVWCSYKYLCAGPGATGGMFVHQKHSNSSRPRCSGWWGVDLPSRFITVPEFSARDGAAGFVLSNPSVLGTIPLHASLSIFAQVPKLLGKPIVEEEDTSKGLEDAISLRIMPLIQRKGQLMTSYLEYLLENPPIRAKRGKADTTLRCVSPRRLEQRTSTLCVIFRDIVSEGAEEVEPDTSKYSDALNRIIQRLKDKGVLADTRSPDLIRFSPAPLYNTYEEVYRLACCVTEALSAA